MNISVEFGVSVHHSGIWAGCFAAAEDRILQTPYSAK
jgi:hypothetical protein